jgi:transposase InsO family protein
MALVAPAITSSEVEPQPMTWTAPRNISLIWHHRLGYIGNTSLLKMAANNRAFGLPPTATISPNTLCWACASGKAVRQPFPTSGHISTKPLQLLHTDIAGPMPTASAGGARYFVTVLDDFSKFKAVKPIAKRNDAPSFIKEVILNWESQTNHKTAAIRHDRAKEYMAEELTDWYKSRGIEMQPTTGYSPQKNGAAERLNRTLWETTLAMLADSGLPDKWWAEALSHACHLRNVCSSTGGPTPWELLKGELPDLRTLRVFGAPCMVKVPDQRRNKLQHKTQPGRLLGFDLPNVKSYRVLTASGIIRSRDITVDEEFTSHADVGMSNFDDEIGIAPAVVHPVAPTICIEPKTSTSTATAASPTTSTPPAPAIASATEDLVAPTDAPSSNPPVSTAAPRPPYDPTAGENDSPQTAAHHRSSRDTKGVPPARFIPGTAKTVFRLIRRNDRHG